MVKAFEDAADSLAPGRVSAPVNRLWRSTQDP
jgi:parvulin-like peptidyl-prolyl isomerase